MATRRNDPHDDAPIGDEYMSPDDGRRFMDDWAHQLNENAARILYDDLLGFGQQLADEGPDRRWARRRLDWHASTLVEDLRRLRNTYAEGKIQRGGGRAPVYDRDDIRESVISRHELHPSESFLNATRIVASSVSRKRGHSPEYVIKLVRRYCDDLRW